MGYKVYKSMLKSTTEALRIIHTSWLLHKVGLMQIEVDDLHVSRTSCKLF